MSKNTGKPYELLVHDIYSALTQDDRFTSVEHDVELEGHDGPRQIDVLLRSQVANLELLTVIECRDYAKRLDITHVDGLHSKLMDVNASKTVLVSRKGFSKKAMGKAARLGITTCLASEASEVLEAIGQQVPVRANLVASTFDAQFKLKIAHVGQSVAHNAIQTINGVHLLDQLHNELLTGQMDVPTESSEVSWFPSNVTPPYTVHDLEGRPMTITDLDLVSRFEVRYFFGHLNEVPDLSALHDVESEHTTFIIDIEHVPNILASLEEFRTADELPEIQRLTLNLIAIRDRG